MRLSVSHCLAISSSTHHTLIPTNCVILIRWGGCDRNRKGYVVAWRGHRAMMRQLGRDRGNPACQGKLLSFQPRGARGEELTAALFFSFLLLLLLLLLLPPPPPFSSSRHWSRMPTVQKTCPYLWSREKSERTKKETEVETGREWDRQICETVESWLKKCWGERGGEGSGWIWKDKRLIPSTNPTSTQIPA